jgi:anti-anti-sigma regulatory factor
MSIRPRSPESLSGGGQPMTVRIDRATGHVDLAGRLDRATAVALYDAISELLHDDSPHWTVDVSRLAVTDHGGLKAIGTAYRRALRHGRRLTLQGSSPSLRAALVRLRLDQHVLHDGRVSA